MESEISLSVEEVDNLHRSTKIQKQVLGISPQADHVAPTVASVEPSSPERSLFSTSIGLRLERKVVSYRYVCSSLGYSHISNNDDDSSGLEKKCLCIPWKRAVIVKLLGKKIGLRLLQTRLSKLWQTTSSMEVIDLENDYFLVQFGNLDDLNHVLENGPWMIMDHYLVIQKWRPEFFPFEDNLRRVAVWVRVPGLPVEYYDSKVLRRIGNSLGHTIKVDANTLRQKSDAMGEVCTDRAKFARLCVEQPWKTFLFSSKWMFLARWRVMALGPWMLVQKGGRRPPYFPGGGGGNLVVNHGKNPLIKDKKSGGSHFDILQKSADLEGPVDLIVPTRTDNPSNSPSVMPKSASVKRPVVPHDSVKSQKKGVSTSDTSKSPKRNNCPTSSAAVKGKKGTWPFVSPGDSGDRGRVSIDNLLQNLNMGLGQNLLGRAHASSCQPPDKRNCDPLPLDPPELLGPHVSSTTVSKSTDTGDADLSEDSVVLRDLATVDLDDSKTSETIKDVSTGDGTWLYDRFSHLLPSHTVEEIVARMAGNEAIGEDRLIWNRSHDGTFSTKSAYEGICYFPLVANDLKWKNLWHWSGPTQAKYFLWLVVKGGLKTNCLRSEHGLAASDTCPLCGSRVETDKHILWECVKVRAVWEAVLGVQPHMSAPGTSLATWVFQNVSHSRDLGDGLLWSLVFGIACWILWSSRNEVVFQQSIWDAQRITHRILVAAHNFVRYSRMDGGHLHRSRSHVVRKIIWSPPQHDWMKWNLDGSVVGQSRRSASGGVLRDGSGRWISGFTRNVGRSSVTLVELWAFKDAIDISISKRLSSIWLESDSSTAVNFVLNGVPSHHPCFSLISSIRSSLNSFPHYVVSHIHREGNSVADALARLGHSFPLGLHIFSIVPPSVSTLLLADVSGVGFSRLTSV
ncbi:Ribonuclease H domain [Sesbania bispinosa]|nr:Ribonuclease H domain [Sesbania bispinosa]